MKIALTSVSDIMNYGDTLFPFIARQEILRYIPNATFRFFTPTDSIIENEHFFECSENNLKNYSPDVILTIGGEVIHKYDTAVWADMYHQNVIHPSNIIFGWLNYPAKFKSWFSVGALDLEITDDNTITQQELSNLNYIGVRGILSKKILEKKIMLNINPAINIVPDIGWVFPRYFDNHKEVLEQISKTYNIKLKSNNYFIFNVNWTSIPDDKVIEILDVLTQFQKRTKLKLIILNVISSYRQMSISLADYFKNNRNVLYLENLNLQNTGSLLINTRFFIGSSLHCAITAMASCKPAAVIHSCALTKLQDLFGHMMMVDYLSNDWNDFPKLIEKLYTFREKHILKKYVEFIQTCFDEKMSDLCKKISSIVGDAK